MTTHNDPRALELIEKLHGYQPPQGDQAARYEQLGEAVRDLALLFARLCPGSPELTLALRCLFDARMKANQAIATNEPRLGS